MKRSYWFIILFEIWCFASALWYFLSVKGVNTDLSTFNPHNSLVAILEITIMLLVACLLGYAIAWWLRQDKVEKQAQSLERLRVERFDMIEKRKEFRNQLQRWREKYKKDLAASRQRVKDLISEREELHRHVTKRESALVLTKQETKDAQLKIQQLDSEASTLRYRIRQMEFQIKEDEEKVLQLTQELAKVHSRKEKAPLAVHPFVRPPSSENKDDLTKIKGIGPFIEKRLNMIGIYTFQQLAELTPDFVERVGAAIEFFPHRIIRDNWVGQARNRITS